MPTNLPPECQEAERRYRAAKTPDEKLARLQDFIKLIPKHKGTDKLRADLRRKLSKLNAAAQTRKKTGKQVSAFRVEREGAGQAVIIGVSNVGKSALVGALTNASPQVADTPFTTWTPTPGMALIDHVPIQLVDTPPLDRDYIEPEFLDLIRTTDLVIIVVDLQTYPLQQLEDTVDFLLEQHIVPCRLWEQCAGKQKSIEKPTIIAVNKVDDETWDDDFSVLCELLENDWPLVPISATTGNNLDSLNKVILEQLDIIRVYSKPPGKEVDFTAPFIMKQGETVEIFAGKVHQDFISKLKCARIWGSGAFDGQMVARDYILKDGDVVELRLER
ncbi:MAG: 50S ribosome-binding GTPase [Anaerolineales bacterium]|nr:50S ribosome-binding GTPase [Anaerolineales bacterium]